MEACRTYAGHTAHGGSDRAPTPTHADVLEPIGSRRAASRIRRGSALPPIASTRWWVPDSHAKGGRRWSADTDRPANTSGSAWRRASAVHMRTSRRTPRPARCPEEPRGVARVVERVERRESRGLQQRLADRCSRRRHRAPPARRSCRTAGAGGAMRVAGATRRAAFTGASIHSVARICPPGHRRVSASIAKASSRPGRRSELAMRHSVV